MISLVVVLAQVFVPLGLIAWLAVRRFGTRAEAAAVIVLTGAWLSAVTLAGFWFVLPRWVPWIYAAAGVWFGARSWRRHRVCLTWPGRDEGRPRIAVIVLAAMGCMALWGEALVARVPPSGTAIDLAFPLAGGHFVVANGGSRTVVNAHLATPQDPRYAPVRGQAHAVDIVAVNRWDVRAPGLLPSDPSRYVVFGMPVHAPCSGSVSQIENTQPDLSPPHAEPGNALGNRVVLDCGDFQVFLAHLKLGSVTVRAGQRVARGAIVGSVGNSGHSGEPHLHVHAQRRGSGALELGGEPLPMRFGTRYLVRNDRIDRP